MVTSMMQVPNEGLASSNGKSAPQQVVDGQLREGLSTCYPTTKHDETTSTGYLELSGSETNYRGATYWATILENVST